MLLRLGAITFDIASRFTNEILAPLLALGSVYALDAAADVRVATNVLGLRFFDPQVVWYLTYSSFVYCLCIRVSGLGRSSAWAAHRFGGTQKIGVTIRDFISISQLFFNLYRRDPSKAVRTHRPP